MYNPYILCSKIKVKILTGQRSSKLKELVIIHHTDIKLSSTCLDIELTQELCCGKFQINLDSIFGEEEHCCIKKIATM